ncbi:MAG TPA: SPFH domain-containing protein [Solirubrobacterales bacterium]|nr:SPFH domain-containing protein [Solirubrobacterales bacterium]
MSAGLIALIALAVLAVIIVARGVRIVPQARAGIVERLGRYHRTLSPGLALVIPIVDRVLPYIDLRDQVVSFPPQSVITEDNIVVDIDTVVYYEVTDPKSYVYEVAQPIVAIEQLSVTTLRNLIGGLDMEKALTSRDEINAQLRTILDEATGEWGIRVIRVELKAIDPPHTVQAAMESQMKAEREKRAAILTAEGQKESQILNADGARQAQILDAEGRKQAQVLEAAGEREAAILRAEGEARAVEITFKAIHEGDPSPELLNYLYLTETLPNVADGEASKLWIVPSSVIDAARRLGDAAEGLADKRPPGAGH